MIRLSKRCPLSDFINAKQKPRKLEEKIFYPLSCGNPKIKFRDATPLDLP
jgi:hypothetical protein